MSWQYAVSAGVLIAAMLGGLGYFILSGKGDQRFAECSESSIAGALGGPFELVDTTGRTVTDSDVLTRPSLIYFGYTFCPDVCPFDAARNAQAVELLAARGMDAQAVFISIDPERDTPEVLGRFVGNLGARVIGLTGTPAQVQAASQAYRTYYRRQDGDGAFYLVDHSTFSYLALPGYGVVAVYRRSDTAEDIAESMACFIQSAN